MAATKFADGVATKFGRRISVTLPDYLFDLIKKDAVENNRSISAEIVTRLESFVPPKVRKVIEREGVNWGESR